MAAPGILFLIWFRRVDVFVLVAVNLVLLLNLLVLLSKWHTPAHGFSKAAVPITCEQKRTQMGHG